MPRRIEAVIKAKEPLPSIEYRVQRLTSFTINRALKCQLINRKSSTKPSVSVARNGTLQNKNKKVTLPEHQLKMPCLSETRRILHTLD